MAAIDVVTLAEAKTALVGVTSSSRDALLSRYITAVSARLDELCGPILTRAVTELHDGGGWRLQLNQPPLYDVTSVTEYASTSAQVLTVETNASKPSYGYIATTGMSAEIRRRAGGGDAVFTSGRRNVVVEYRAGRFESVSAVTDVFKLPALVFLEHVWRRQEGGGSETYGPPIGLTDTGIPSFGVPNVVADLLAGERRPLRIGAA